MLGADVKVRRILGIRWEPTYRLEESLEYVGSRHIGLKNPGNTLGADVRVRRILGIRWEPTYRLEESLEYVGSRHID